MNKKIVVINGHPNGDSFCSALANAYIKGAVDHEADIRMIDLSKADFDPVLQFGYSKRMELEHDLELAQRDIRWADHLVIVYPNWWGVMPALLKGFFDRVFLPGFAFQYRSNSSRWDKLLLGKTAHLIVTSDTPNWYNVLAYGRAGQKVMVRNILGFCGIRTNRVTGIGPLVRSTPGQRQQWLDSVYHLAAGGK